jgi:hypothetical protein
LSLATIKPNVLRPSFAGRLHRHIRIDDRARVNRGDRCLKNVDAFEKERTLLRKEDRETLVGCDDKLIGFDLCKVGIDREIYCDCRTRNEVSPSIRDRDRPAH